MIMKKTKVNKISKKRQMKTHKKGQKKNDNKDK